MQDFIFGVLAGQLSVMVVVAVLFFRKDRQQYKGSHRTKRFRKIDGIWTVREEGQRKPVDPNRVRVRKAVILERTRRG